MEGSPDVPADLFHVFCRKAKEWMGYQVRKQVMVRNRQRTSRNRGYIYVKHLCVACCPFIKVLPPFLCLLLLLLTLFKSLLV